MRQTWQTDGQTEERTQNQTENDRQTDRQWCKGTIVNIMKLYCQTFEVRLCLNGNVPKLSVPLCFDCLGSFLSRSFV